MKADQVILSRLLPKTGQVISYEDGDDGAIEAGWWRGLSVADNKTRFIAKTIDGNSVVIDLATGLMWDADRSIDGFGGGATMLWVDAVLFPLTRSYAGFDDWRMPNIKELRSIVDFTKTNPAIDTNFFPDTESDYFWTSTTYVSITTSAWAVKFDIGWDGHRPKGLVYPCRYVRGGL